MVNPKASFYSVFLIMLMVLCACSRVSVETADNFEVVELPDGSIVYLNHNSAVSYDEEFSSRTLDVKGEIFFSVTERETPFIVNTDMGEIMVLGTEFNVKANIKEIEVEVEEGIVELKTNGHSNKVKPGEVAVYKEVENVIQKGKAEFKFKIWINDLKREFKKLGKEIKSSAKEIGKESKEAGKELKQELRKLK